jgi:hypothetical protein
MDSAVLRSFLAATSPLKRTIAVTGVAAKKMCVTERRPKVLELCLASGVRLEKREAPVKRFTLCLLVLWAVVVTLTSAPAAYAVDDLVLINQSTIINGLPGCPGPNPGNFPIVICQTGSYKLSGNLVVSAAADGVDKREHVDGTQRHVHYAAGDDHQHRRSRRTPREVLPTCTSAASSP